MSALSEFLQHFANGLVLGFLYALVGIGLSMVYGILRMINFAHGEILMVGRVPGAAGIGAGRAGVAGAAGRRRRRDPDGPVDPDGRSTGRC